MSDNYRRDFRTPEQYKETVQNGWKNEDNFLVKINKKLGDKKLVLNSHDQDRIFQKASSKITSTPDFSLQKNSEIIKFIAYMNTDKFPKCVKLRAKEKEHCLPIELVNGIIIIELSNLDRYFFLDSSSKLFKEAPKNIEYALGNKLCRIFTREQVNNNLLTEDELVLYFNNL